jgi:hypothetical protein
VHLNSALLKEVLEEKASLISGMIYFYSCTLVFSLLLKIQTILLLYSKKGNEKCEVECCGSEERMDWHEKV